MPRISDGFNITGHIAAVRGLWPEYEFTYRIAKEFWIFQYDQLPYIPMTRMNDVETTVSKILAEHLIELNTVNDDGTKVRVPFGAPELGLLAGPVRVAMCEHIMGRRQSTIDLIASTEKKSEPESASG